jgi:hypothetical protein
LRFLLSFLTFAPTNLSTFPTGKLEHKNTTLNYSRKFVVITI